MFQLWKTLSIEVKIAVAGVLVTVLMSSLQMINDWVIYHRGQRNNDENIPQNVAQHQVPQAVEFEQTSTLRWIAFLVTKAFSVLTGVAVVLSFGFSSTSPSRLEILALFLVIALSWKSLSEISQDVENFRNRHN